jgi:hypothetical protein
MTRPETDERRTPAMRRSRAAAVALTYGTLIPLAAWGFMLIAGVSGAGIGYLPALLATTVCVLVADGVRSLLGFIRDGSR